MNETTLKFKQLIAKCWSDAEFKERLLQNPAEVLALEGIEFPKGMTVSVTQNTSNSFTLVIPATPESFKSEALEALAEHVDQMVPHFQPLPPASN